MNIFPRSELKSLMESEEELCVSIYLSFPEGDEQVRKMQIKLKNAIKEAEKQLESLEIEEELIGNILKPLEQMERNIGFQEDLSSALVVFLTPSGMKNFWIPMNVKDVVVVQNRCYIKPLLSLFSGEEQFYLLALSRKKVRLFKGSRFALTPLDVPGMPESMEDALNYDEREKIGPRIAPKPSPRASRGDKAYFHGHGAGVDMDHDEVRKYLKIINDVTTDYLKDCSSPFLVAAVDRVLSRYRKVNTCSGLIEESISGNPDELSTYELHKKALETLEPVFKKSREDAFEQYSNLVGSDRVASDLEKIVSASAEGRVKVSFLASGEQRWGSYDPSTSNVKINETRQQGDHDLLDFVAYETILNGGTVYVVPGEKVPGGGKAAAILRY